MSIKIEEFKAPAVTSQSTEITPSDKLQHTLTAKIIEVMKTIVSDNTMRLEGYRKNPKLLDKGIYYSNAYYAALKDLKEPNRIKFFLDKGSFHHGYVPPKFYTIPYSLPNTKAPLLMPCYVLKKGKTASEALEKLREGLSFLACGDTCQIAIYEALLAALGKEKFDAFFAANTSTPLMIHVSGRENPIDNPLDYLLEYSLQKTAKKGDMAFFQNAQGYAMKHLMGDATGFWTICTDDSQNNEKYIGLGLNPSGNTQYEIGTRLYKEFNSKPIGFEILPKGYVQDILDGITFPESLNMSVKKYVETCKKVELDPDTFMQYGGGQLAQTATLNMERVMTLVNGSIEEGRKLLDEWKAALITDTEKQTKAAE